MPRRSRSLPLVFVAAIATSGLGACGDRASGETRAGASAASRPAGATRSPCPSVEQVGEAAGFQVTFTQAIGSSPDTWIGCQYEMTGRYRGNFLELTGDPASKADSVFADMKRAVKGMKGTDAELDKIDVGAQGWAFGSNSMSQAAAVVGSHVWHASLEYMLSGSIGDQKDAMVRVLQLVAR
ncbi:MAG TPA: hypothetical protein VFN40_09465 [Gemmatimonadales bacterium]|nr:hypothetical protein [Gemmatimonadales bacterium]